MIEIMGLPGSGKSYLLNNTDIKNVFKFDETLFYNKCKDIKSLEKVKYTFFTILSSFDILLVLLMHISFTKKNKKGRFKHYIEFFKYLVLFNCVFKEYKKNNLVILDQGVLQYVWSFDLLYGVGFSYNKLNHYLYKRLADHYNITVCYYKVDYKIAAKQAILREKKCETDYMDFDSLKHLYKNHFNDYEIMKNYIKNEYFYIVETKEHFVDLIKRFKET